MRLDNFVRVQLQEKVVFLKQVRLEKTFSETMEVNKEHLN